MIKKIIGAILGLALIAVIPFCHGSGNGSGSASEGSASVNIPSQTEVPETEAPEEDKISEILIEGDKIYFDGDLCADEDELKQKITDIGTDREYNFKYDNAIKGTYDKVEQILIDLEDALNIKVNRS